MWTIHAGSDRRRQHLKEPCIAPVAAGEYHGFQLPWKPLVEGGTAVAALLARNDGAMTGDEDDAPRYVCHECIGDAYLKAEIQREEKLHTCVLCGKKERAVAFDELCDRVHKIVSEEFDPTASEPESWTEEDWEREGDAIDEVLTEILECGEPLVEALKRELSDQYFSIDDASVGEEDPYGEEARYRPRNPDGYGLYETWSDFETEIRSRARFFSSTAESALDDIFGELSRFRNHERPLIREAGPGTMMDVLYRARRAFGHAEIARIIEHPARELGPPPSRSAGSGRMNPRWISMFYGALDPDTCVAEIRPPVGSSIVIGKFTIIRKLKLLDLNALERLFVEKASYFDPSFRRLRHKAQFLKRLVVIMSRPVLPSDEDYHYLPTQAVAEYLSEKMKPRLDGLIFPSSQRGGKGENVVLFRRASSVELDGSDGLISETNFGWGTDDDADPDITVWTKKKREPSKVITNEGDEPVWLDGPELVDDPTNLTEPPALHVELDAIEVRDIQAVEYFATKRRVRRYKEREGKLPF
jgi:hypothetical protein